MKAGKQIFCGILGAALMLSAPGCAHKNTCSSGTCGVGCGKTGCSIAGCKGDCRAASCCHKAYWALFGWAWKKDNSIPETLPLGSTLLAHTQVMETNGEAADFIIYDHEFVGQTAELNSAGKDHILEIAARMPSTPFPVLVERSPNNADPELDAIRRNLVVQVLTDLGNQDAQQRTVVATSYGPGYTGRRGEQMYYQHIYQGGLNNNFGGNGNGGFGGGGFGGGGF
ncbi:MAG: hypothetical protein KDA80_13565 [Planctomycetaceae bacterium]|nr:hypothetical protein [Planctomycetaceae bacterium]